MTQDPNHSIHDSVLSAITNGNVSMRPRWQFLLSSILFTGVVVLVGIACIALMSFIVFALHQSGVWFTPQFGFSGMPIMVQSLPWLLLGIGVVALVILEGLMRRYAFAYRKSVVVSLIALILFVGLGGLLLAQTSFHPRMFKRAQEGRLPFAGAMYRDYGSRKPGHILSGTFIERSDRGYIIEVAPGELILVATTSNTRFLIGPPLVAGDEVVVLGSVSHGEVEALGIRKIKPGARVHMQRFQDQELR